MRYPHLKQVTMEIEDLIDQKERIKQGIFFTKPHIADKIIGEFDMSKINSVIDSAAGSCNFLIPLAMKYPEINFYGVEKNPLIYKEVKKKIEGLPNIFYFQGDILLDNFPIPKCDLYLGNPPFINFSDLDSEYREVIKPIWLDFFPESKGFKMLLGDSRGDIAQLIFYYTIRNYLKDGGKIGVILPDSLIKGNSATAGFREFKEVRVGSLVDISLDNPFDNTSRNCFYFLGQKGGFTTFPLKYIKDDKIINLIKCGDDLIEEGSSILKPSDYIARQGINTLGANSVFIFKTTPPFKSTLIRPLLKSSDINPFSYKASYSLLYPYRNGKPIHEDELKTSEPEVYRYLKKHKKFLEKRKSRFITKCWYALFGVGEYTESKYKVVWRGLGATELMAAVTEDVIPNQAMNCYISCKSRVEADYICGIINSSLYKNQLMVLNEKGAKSFAQPNTINKIFIPEFRSEIIEHKTIAELSARLHVCYSTEIYDRLDNIVEQLYISCGLLK